MSDWGPEGRPGYFSFLNYVDDHEQNVTWMQKKKIRGLYRYNDEMDEDNIYVISYVYPEVEYLKLEDITLSESLISIEYSLSNRKKDRERIYTCRVKLSRKNTVRFADKEFEEQVICDKTLIRKPREFIAICRRYFEYVINSEDISFISKRTEWRTIGTKKEFIPITSDGGWKITDKSIFNYLYFKNNIVYRVRPNPFAKKDDYSEKYHGHTKEEILAISDSFRLSLYCLKNNPSLIGVFSYTIYAFLFNYLKPYDTVGRKYREEHDCSPLMDEFAFSINIYGKDIYKVRCLANIFSNIFSVDMLKNPGVRGRQYMSASSLRTQFKKVLAYSSIPVIVTNKTPLKRSSSIVKHLFCSKNEGRVHIFPVYLNTYPMNADEILDFDIGFLGDQMPDKEILFTIKDEISFLLLRFVWYLSEISEREYSRYTSDQQEYDRGLLKKQEVATGPLKRQEEFFFYDALFSQTYNKLEEKGFDMQENACKILLFASFKGFCEYLSRDFSLKEDADELLQQAYSFFFEDKGEDKCKEQESSFQIQNDRVVLSAFGKYLKHLFSNEERDEPFLHYIKKDTGKSYNGECYFLDFNEFFKDFEKFNTPAISVTEDKLKGLLKQKEVLVVRNNGKQLSMQRRVDKKLVNLLIIKKDLFDTLVDKL